ncbi:putative RNA methyltransferase [Obelidium mucronatum]|nr:putative RNA methyltransferase [Obelidium mucronatum]
MKRQQPQQQHFRRQRTKAQPDQTAVKAKNPVFVSPNKPRPYTVSVAISASMIANLEKPELRTFLAGQIARMLSIFQVDEVVIYEDPTNNQQQHLAKQSTEGPYEAAAKKNLDASVFLARILQFCECPPYLRKSLFPIHRDLQFAAMINIESPHHTRIDDPCPFREGVTLETNTPGKVGTLVDIGLRNSIPAFIKDKEIKAGVRVTVKLDNPAQIFHNNSSSVPATVISPNFPRESQGLYWGYSVRLAASIGKVLSESSYEGGYDMSFGVSEQAPYIGEVLPSGGEPLPSFKHLMVVFGGSKGLEYSIGADETLEIHEEDAKDMFTYYMRPLKSQGTRRIRTEESVLIGMTAIKNLLT